MDAAKNVIVCKINAFITSAKLRKILKYKKRKWMTIIWRHVGAGITDSLFDAIQWTVCKVQAIHFPGFLAGPNQKHLA